EEIALFGDPVERLLVHGAQGLAGVVVNLLELVAIAAEPAVVFALVYIATVLEHGPEFLDTLFVVCIGRSHPPVILDAEVGKRFFELLDYLVDMLLDRYIAGVGGAFDVDAVLVRPRQKERIDSALAFESDQRICDQSGVNVAKMRASINVVDRCSNV